MKHVVRYLWMRFQEWLRKKIFFCLIFLKNRPKGAFLATYPTSNGCIS